MAKFENFLFLNEYCFIDSQKSPNSIAPLPYQLVSNIKKKIVGEVSNHYVNPIASFDHRQFSFKNLHKHRCTDFFETYRKNSPYPI